MRGGLLKSLKKTEVGLKSDKKNRHFLDDLRIFISTFVTSVNMVAVYSNR